MGISAGFDLFRLAFTLSPIVLTDGIVTLIPGGLPIICLTQALDFTHGLLAGSSNLTNMDDFFAHFTPLPGSTLISQQIGKYPFANQAVAANAVIRNPRHISMRMICPAKGEGGFATKLATMLALQATLALHNTSGGTYVIATPSGFFTNCVMLDMRDTSSSESKQVQDTWQLDFEVPLLTLQDAQAAQNGLMGQITAGTPIGGIPSWSGTGQAIGNPASLGAVGVIPAASGPVASVFSSPTSLPASLTGQGLS